MTVDEAMERLSALGTARNRKIYGRHGVSGAQFGLSSASLTLLQREIRCDHALALALWETGNHDARLLALRVADPAQADEALLARWGAALDNYILADAFSAFVAQGPLALARLRGWQESENEWLGQVAWNLVAHLALYDAAQPDSFFLPRLDQIERTIHQRANRVRHAMNNALIAIALRNAALEQRALEAAAQIGTVRVDHGATACKTPDAAAYVAKSKAYRAQQASARA